MTNPIRQYNNVFSSKECDFILSTRVKYSKTPLGLKDLLIFRDESYSEWNKIFNIIETNMGDIIDNYVGQFLNLFPKHALSVSHIGFLNDKSGSFTEIHYDWELVFFKKRTIIKPFVAIIYLNDDFDGGDLLFPLQQERTIPKKGSVVVFPCNYTYPHVSQPVVKGNKHVCRITYKMDPESYAIEIMEI